jgi:uncharacterized protein (DUF58 family)
MKKIKRKTNLKFTQKRHLLPILILYILILACAALPAVYMSNIYGYLPVLLVLSAVVVSFAYGLLLQRCISYMEMCNLEICERGTAVKFTVKVKNRSILVFPKLEVLLYVSDLFGNDDAVRTTSLTLGSYEQRQLNFTVRFDHIGTYSGGLQQIKVYDILGIFTFVIENDKRYKVQVAPKIYDLSGLKLSENALLESQYSLVPSTIDGMDYCGVREYVLGDPIKIIHWKLSAHSGTYMTKQMESYGTSGISVVLNFISPAYSPETLMSIFDCLVETGLSVCSYAKKNGMDYEILYYDRNEQKRRYNPADLHDYRELMALLPIITTDPGTCDASRLLREEANSLYAQSNIAYCTAFLTEDAIQTLLQIKNAKRNPLLFFVVPKQAYGEHRVELLRPLKRLEAVDIPYYVISSADELSKEG